MIPVILSGGSGTRLWPLSRKKYPKQFLSLNSEISLFQETYKRLEAINLIDPMVVCSENSRFIVAEHLRNAGCEDSTIVLEPSARNTCPAIAVAALIALEKDSDPVLMVLPADHVIGDVDAFGKAADKAEKLAQEGKLITFGVSPTEPNTGYGYIECGEDIHEGSFKIKNFKEKPNKENAQKMLDQGGFLWNSGMFVFKASVFLEELKKTAPEIIEHAKNSIRNAKTDLDFIRLNNDDFIKCDDISIDYAVMEKTDNSAVVCLDAHWCDVGSWASLWDIAEKDDNGNACKGDVVAIDSSDNYFYSEDKLVAAIGVNNLTVVDTKDALLIADRKDGNIRKIVKKLRAEGRAEADIHRVVYRPWGHYDTICSGSRDLVKRITVKAGAKLSKQMHHHRAEHWVVVRGTAQVTKGDETFILAENESVYLPLGVTHSLKNPGKIPLEIIEVQTGSYLGEDDIVRFEDLYGRA